MEIVYWHDTIGQSTDFLFVTKLEVQYYFPLCSEWTMRAPLPISASNKYISSSSLNHPYFTHILEWFYSISGASNEIT